MHVEKNEQSDDLLLAESKRNPQGLGLSEPDIKTLFGYFDVDGSGEIDFSEFRRFLQGGTQQTGLAVCDSLYPHTQSTATRSLFSLQ